MSKHRYEIKMTVPIGIRKGVITIDGDCGRIRGTLDILGHEQPFLGNIENDGSCEFFGDLVSLRQTIPYHAKGKILNEFIQLEMYSERNIFYITGKEIMNEEIL